MKNLFLLSFLFIVSISFSQDEIKHNTAFETVEQNCDSLKDIKLCYLERFKLLVNRKFSDEIILNEKLSKHIDDKIYLEIEIDESGKFIAINIETKSKEVEKIIQTLVDKLPVIKPFLDDNNTKIKLEAILEFRLKKINYDSYIKPDTKKDLTSFINPRFKGCNPKFDEVDSKKCFEYEMMNHIKSNFNYPVKAINKNISGKTIGNVIINKEGKIEHYIIYNADVILQRETLRILKLLPTFIPGMQNGKDVSVSYAQPLVFKLN
jgi:uncharacterized protein YuzE